jgi:hypothetical protein
MSKIVLYKSFLERYPWLEDEYKKRFKKMPNVLIRSFEGFFYEFTTQDIPVKEEFILKVLQVLDAIKEQLFIKEKSMYLCMIIESYGRSEMIQDYYKTWKGLKKRYEGGIELIHDIDNFYLGYEYKTRLNKSIVYCGNAKFKFSDMNKALNVLYDNQNNSFIYITSANLLTEDDKVKELYDMLLNDNVKTIGNDLLDFYSLYDNMLFNDSVIKIAANGEEFCMDIIQKSKGAC